MISRDGRYEIDTTMYEHEDEVIHLDSLAPEEAAKKEMEIAANKSLSQVGEAAMEVAKLQAQLKLAKKKLREAEKTYCKAVEAMNKPPATEKTSKKKGKPQSQAIEEPPQTIPAATVNMPPAEKPKPKLLDRSQLPPPPAWQEIELAELELSEELQTPCYEAGLLSLGQLKEALGKGFRSFSKLVDLDVDDAKTISSTLKEWLEENYPAEFPPANNGDSTKNRSR